MANIKLKDLLKEMATAGGVVSNNPWLKEEDDTPKFNVKELVSSIGNYNSLGEGIYGKGNLKEVAETLSKIAEVLLSIHYLKQKICLTKLQLAVT